MKVAVRNLFATLALAIGMTCAQAALPEADSLAERMLASLGGREAWARTKNTVNDSRQDWDGDPSELRVVITMDFERPRVRVETWGKGLHVVRALDGDKHWRHTRDGKIEPLTPGILEGDRQFYAGHVYRTLHRLAKRDPALTTSIGREGRLEVHEGGKRIAWYALDRSGAPYLYGAHDDETGSIFGPWSQEVSGIRHPAWVTRDGGKWRAMLRQLQVNVPLDDALFTRP